MKRFFYSVCDNPGLCSICKTTINHPPSLKRLSSFVPKNLTHLLTYKELFNNEEVSLFTFFSVMFQKKKLLQSLTPETQFELVKKSSLTFCCDIKNNCQEKAAHYFFHHHSHHLPSLYIFFLSISFCTPWISCLICFTNLRRFPIQQVPVLGEKKER